MGIEEDVNDTDFSPTDVLTRALRRAEEKNWKKVMVLYVDEEKGFGQITSSGESLLEMGLIFWISAILQSEALLDIRDLRDE